ncbi:MAG: hypothetical protein H6728_08910 [Myxococcales bacterium]|nr:hypothetical protein [Myxococcales bacterium]
MLCRRFGIPLFFGLFVLMFAIPSLAWADAPPPKISVSQDELAQYRFLSVQVRVELRYRNTTRTRSKSFLAFYKRKANKRLDIQNGGTWLNLGIETIPPNQIKLMGALKLGDELQPIRIESGPILPKQQFHFSTTAKVKKIAEAKIHVSAVLLKNPKQRPASSFVLTFERVSLSRLFRKVAEFQGLKLSFDKSIPEKHGLTVKIRASSRKQVTDVICKKFALRCEVMGQVLWVRP